MSDSVLDKEEKAAKKLLKKYPFIKEMWKEREKAFNGIRQFALPLTPVQKQYLEALHLKEDSLLMYKGKQEQDNRSDSDADA